MTTMEYPTINVKATGARIKQLRKEKGIKVTELSEFMGFSEPQAVYKWQRGESLPTVDNLFALSRIFNTSIDDILVGDDGVSFCLPGNALEFSDKQKTLRVKCAYVKIVDFKVSFRNCVSGMYTFKSGIFRFLIIYELN